MAKDPCLRTKAHTGSEQSSFWGHHKHMAADNCTLNCRILSRGLHVTRSHQLYTCESWPDDDSPEADFAGGLSLPPLKIQAEANQQDSHRILSAADTLLPTCSWHHAMAPDPASFAARSPQQGMAQHGLSMGMLLALLKWPIQVMKELGTYCLASANRVSRQ